MDVKRLVLVGALLSLSGCAEQGSFEAAQQYGSTRREGAAYDQAAAAGTASAWSGFLGQYPAGAHAAQARAQLAEAQWRELKQRETAAGYLQFLAAAPLANPHRAEAKDRCRALLLQGSGSAQDYSAFLRLSANDPSAGALEQKLEQLRAQSAGSGPAAVLFFYQYPGTPEAAKLLPAVYEAEFRRASEVDTRLAYHYFVSRFPSAPQADAARGKLAGASAGASADVSALDYLPKLRESSPALQRLECRSALAQKLKADVYGPSSERWRDALREISSGGNTVPYECRDAALAVPAKARPVVAGAVRSLARLLESQAALNSLFEAPAQIAEKSRQVAAQSGSLADEAESYELEIEALYNNMPADPSHPDDTASKNAREAIERANGAWQQSAQDAAGGSGRREAVGRLQRRLDRQAGLLLEIIAHYESPAVSAEADE